MTDTAKAFSLDIRDNGIGVVTIDVPGESMNTLKATFVEEVSELMSAIKGNKDLKGLVFISGKPSSFVAGADIRMINECRTAEDAESLARQGQALFDELEALTIPVIAAIHGPALGGGLELALACHARVLSDSPKTVLGLPEVQLGLLPGSGGTQRLPRIVGIQQGLTLMLTGKQLRAKQAKKLGLANEVVPESILLDAAMEMALKGKPATPKPKLNFMGKVLEGPMKGVVFSKAREQAQKKAKGNYPAIDCIIDTIKTGVTKGMKAGLAFEAKKFGELAMTPESQQLRNIFFATTEMKKETGAEGTKPSEVKKVGVLGGGLMGGGIAHVTINKAKLPVRLKDINHDGISNAMAYHNKLLQPRLKRRHITKADYEKQLLMLTGSLNYSGYKDADIVVEAVFEDLDLKQKMVADIEQNAAEHTIFATNTSSLPITQIAAKAKRPGQVIGLHYFSPVEKMPLAEIITHEGTTPETIATTVQFAKQQGKTPIVVADGAGFYVNRILAPYMNEAARWLLAGEPVEAIDKALVQFGFPVGPVALLDEVGIDVASKVAPILRNELGERFEAPDAFSKLIDDGRKGRKTKKGFYRYDSKAKGKQVDSSVYQVLGIQPNAQASAKAISERCVLPMLNEAAWCLQENIIRSPRDGDIGAIFGIGFPPFRGGPFRYMDALGVAHIVERLEALAASEGERFKPCELLVTMAQENQKFYKD
ncbi:MULTISPECIES: fatty acid oxidation complex subunit alpha FadJ [Gammaproteobacteria]|uniref:fatty acid oxidation complex subunit alpha FadJ n=1 Tax=Gammaproteobacteria TaxID=1236 RepID=UPI000DCFFB95|nr:MULTISPECIES: fatty acid oxidation complex subunit alpha FadJ [Gammaproteobacteria]RTE86900.1 fatty acid oxidation complex subunit alpha FadJ [Aliidiomarina sp. B3213]TCZ93311.1 fatty acid oxidation complex subunit alpha FadJ [Lysobacter sp. N42]